MDLESPLHLKISTENQPFNLIFQLKLIKQKLTPRPPFNNPCMLRINGY
jgi:hypothetical protein